MLAEHGVSRARLAPARKPALEPLEDTELDALMCEIRRFDRWLAECKGKAPQGYIVLKPAPDAVVQQGKRGKAAAKRAAAAEAVNNAAAGAEPASSAKPAAAERAAQVRGSAPAAADAASTSTDSPSASAAEPKHQGAPTDSTNGKAPDVVKATGAPGESLCPGGWVYADFDPLLLEQKRGERMVELPTFDAALDEFYSKVRLMCS
jgi:hypothetical protein